MAKTSTTNRSDSEKAKSVSAEPFFHRLSQPFPEQAVGWRAVLNSAATATFVVLFLYFFQPFDLSRDGASTLRQSLAYGAVTFFVNVSYEWVGRQVLKVRSDVESWTLWKWLVHVTGLISCIAIGNFIYFNASFEWQYFNLQMLGLMLANTFIVGIFPTIAFGLLMQRRARNANLQKALQISSSHNNSRSQHALQNSLEEPLRLNFGANGADRLVVDVHAIRYVEAMQNYISICHVSSGQIGRNLVRQTLAKAESDCAKAGIVRCHRSFLVNPAHIVEVAGNAQGLKLNLADLSDTTVPVSRSYIDEFRQTMSKR